MKIWLRVCWICWAIALLALGAFIRLTYAADATFSWLPNTEQDLAGYRIYSDVEDLPNSSWKPANVVDVGLPATVNGRVAYTIKDIPDIKMTYAATAYDMDGKESDFSSHVTYDPAPSPPSGLQVTVSITTTTVIQ